ncbi:hypothetical protein HPB50_000706 [Hyalomma asiaticum]|uniref:Uncharacterized protein n=1 Tax=Hyalomma asiaticum TaxID=266040 RepID=A0ACB7SJL9_HYAAI|nr:hypothetical protein HPB50_000706 [Hyalomma asiaticum]
MFEHKDENPGGSEEQEEVEVESAYHQSSFPRPPMTWQSPRSHSDDISVTIKCQETNVFHPFPPGAKCAAATTQRAGTASKCRQPRHKGGRYQQKHEEAAAQRTKKEKERARGETERTLPKMGVE